MIVLNYSATDPERITASTTVAASPTLTCAASYRVRTSTTFEPASKFTNISNVSVDLVETPVSSGQSHIVDSIIVFNPDNITHTVLIQWNDGTNAATLWYGTLQAGESAQYAEGHGWQKINVQGTPVVAENSPVIGYTGFPFEYHKIGTAAEAIGNWYAFFKDSGFPGAYVLGAPGLNGWWVDASQTTNAANPAGAAQVGVPRLANPASGSYYVNGIGVGSSVAHVLNLVDIIWYNTGAVVTTTTAQAITVPASSKPARDTYGTTNGDGWQIGILVTTATTNAGAITNMTCSYTNSDGNAGNTATIASFPATAVIGTFVPFKLAAGDRGVRSVESLTLGTSLVTGAVSLVIYRNISSVVNPVANVGGIMNKVTSDPTGIRIYNGSALNWIYRASATTATTMQGTINIVER
jgi:hypothetical protein